MDMDNGKKHDGDDVDLFEPASANAPSASNPISSTEHIETETNVFSVDTLRRAAAQHGGTDTGSFEVSTPTHTVGDVDAADDTLDLDDIDDPLDDDIPQKKTGFFANLFRRSARSDEEDPDELSLDDDILIAPPTPSERMAGNGAAMPKPTLSVDQPPVAANNGDNDEPTTVATIPEVTDSGVFEFNPASNEAVATDSIDIDVSTPAATVPEVTDSGIFELVPPTSEAVTADSADSIDTDGPTPVATVPEVTDSGVFELGPSTSETVTTDSVDADVSTTVTAVPEVTDSGVFELGPSTSETVTTDSVDTDVSTTVTAVPEVTDSGVFEIGQSTGAGSGGDEWEIGWEPKDEEHSADFDVSNGTATATDTDVPPPVFTKLAHVCLYVKDLGQSVDFYGKLGFQKRFVFNRNGSLFGAYLEFGSGNFIELFEDMSRSSAAALGRLAHFCLETPDIDAAMAALSARRVEFTPKKLGCDSTYQIWLKDPDGNEFEIHQYTANSSQIVGGEVEADW